MIEKSSHLPPKKKLCDQTIEQFPSPELQQLELTNQLTIMNLSCFQFRAAAVNVLDRSVSVEIDRIERTVSDMTSSLAKLPQAINASTVGSSCAGVARKSAKLPRSQRTKVYPLFKPEARSR